MKNNSLELFKLDEIDRKVFFWLIDHVKLKSVKSWIEYIEAEYRRKQIIINSECLLNEGLNLVDKYPKTRVYPFFKLERTDSQFF